MVKPATASDQQQQQQQQHPHYHYQRARTSATAPLPPAPTQHSAPPLNLRHAPSPPVASPAPTPRQHQLQRPPTRLKMTADPLDSWQVPKHDAWTLAYAAIGVVFVWVVALVLVLDNTRIEKF
ncbi:MAG: hypothetical protein M1829_003051 [Trizodia sp. TS-e1964]|nr:MAG: hypothetical protein M1829_003051 [Trizodia sp. TS-e1964]